jgi:hypothetical protein
MRNADKKQAHEFAGIIESIADERVRYFYLMLGDALAQATAPGGRMINTSPAHVAGIAARLAGH